MQGNSWLTLNEVLNPSLHDAKIHPHSLNTLSVGENPKTLGCHRLSNCKEKC